MRALTTPHEQALTLLFAELEQVAAAQHEAFLGTPGALARRTNDDASEYWVHRYSDALGRRKESDLGLVEDRAVASHVRALRERIAAANASIARVRMLARAGLATVDRKTYATVASLHNQGLFRAGALLIGSHALDALLNGLGVRAVPYRTGDVDIARCEELALPDVPAFIDMLRESGIKFFEVPALSRRSPSSSYAAGGGSHLRVDPLVPCSDESYPTIAVPELKAHAKGLPYLRYLLASSQESPLLSSHGIVQVPVPERFAVQKLLVLQLRPKGTSKPEKDLRQAAALMEALCERFPGSLEAALGSVPKSARPLLRRAVTALKHHLPASADEAWEALRA